MYKAKQKGALPPARRSRARRYPAYGGIANPAPMPSVDQEEDDGRSESERLVESGSARAEYDQRLLAMLE